MIDRCITILMISATAILLSGCEAVQQLHYAVALSASTVVPRSPRSMAIANETAMPLQVEVAIRFEPYRWFSQDQFFRFRLDEGQTWDSRRPGKCDRVQWRTADAWVGFRTRPLGGAWDEWQSYSLNYKHHANVGIGGDWPEFQVCAVDERGEPIDVEVLADRMDVQPRPEHADDAGVCNLADP